MVIIIYYHLQANHPEEHSEVAPKKAIEKCDIQLNRLLFQGIFLRSKHILDGLLWTNRYFVIIVIIIVS